MKLKKQAIVYLLLSVLMLAVVGYFFIQRQTAENKIPNISKRSGAIGPSSEFLNLQKAVEYYRFEIRRNPELIKNYVELAQLYMQEARVTGRHHEYVAKAEKLLDEALSRKPDNFESNITKASLLLTMHRFEEAKALAETATLRNVHHAFSWGVLSDALKELGDYPGAVKACDKMLSVRPDLRSYARASHLREIHGDLRGAREAMKMACDAGVTGQENRAWCLYHLANLFLKEGKLDTAEYIYKGVLEERPNYPYALAGLADVHSAKQEFNKAEQLLLRAYDLAPEHLFMEKLAETYRAAGQAEKANVLAESVLEAFRQHEQQGWNVNLEWAMFCAKHDFQLDEALKRAEIEYRRRPNNIDVQEVYAWTLHKVGRSAKALPIIEQALQINARSPLLFYRAGMIAKKVADFNKAKNYIEAALKMNPCLFASEIELAQQALKELSVPRPVGGTLSAL